MPVPPKKKSGNLLKAPRITHHTTINFIRHWITHKGYYATETKKQNHQITQYLKKDLAQSAEAVEFSDYEIMWRWSSKNDGALGMAEYPFIAIAPGSTLVRVETPDRVLSVGQIELNCVRMLNRISWNRSVLIIKLHTYDKLNCVKLNFLYAKLNCLKYNCFWH